MSAVFVLVCTIQALYWPLIMKPGTILDWWQVKWLAQLGYFIGIPVMILTKWFNAPILWVGSILWALIIYCILMLICTRYSK